ncbi:serine/arginine repetitive matrix protein 1-like [Penaeus indicus]|uniref:serine/arginine repetitive matrix protein 1-like n=1 Tax=Penaeus indicus TaxID=29960 RepID=UPI00300DA7CE
MTNRSDQMLKTPTEYIECARDRLLDPTANQVTRSQLARNCRWRRSAPSPPWITVRPQRSQRARPPPPCGSAVEDGADGAEETRENGNKRDTFSGECKKTLNGPANERMNECTSERLRPAQRKPASLPEREQPRGRPGPTRRALQAARPLLPSTHDPRCPPTHAHALARRDKYVILQELGPRRPATPAFTADDVASHRANVQGQRDHWVLYCTSRKLPLLIGRKRPAPFTEIKVTPTSIRGGGEMTQIKTPNDLCKNPTVPKKGARTSPAEVTGSRKFTRVDESRASKSNRSSPESPQLVLEHMSSSELAPPAGLLGPLTNAQPRPRAAALTDTGRIKISPGHSSFAGQEHPDTERVHRAGAIKNKCQHALTCHQRACGCRRSSGVPLETRVASASHAPGYAAVVSREAENSRGPEQRLDEPPAGTRAASGGDPLGRAWQSAAAGSFGSPGLERGGNSNGSFRQPPPEGLAEGRRGRPARRPPRTAAAAPADPRRNRRIDNYSKNVASGNTGPSATAPTRRLMHTSTSTYALTHTSTFNEVPTLTRASAKASYRLNASVFPQTTSPSTLYPYPIPIPTPMTTLTASSRHIHKACFWDVPFNPHARGAHAEPQDSCAPALARGGASRPTSSSEPPKAYLPAPLCPGTQLRAPRASPCLPASLPPCPAPSLPPPQRSSLGVGGVGGVGQARETLSHQQHRRRNVLPIKALNDSVEWRSRDSVEETALTLEYSLLNTHAVSGVSVVCIALVVILSVSSLAAAVSEGSAGDGISS